MLWPPSSPRGRENAMAESNTPSKRQWKYDWNDIEKAILERWIAAGMSQEDAEAVIASDLLDAAEEDGYDGA